jgi:hypothetical protein
MKALSIREPWAHMVIHGLKTVEIRTWATHHRGPLLIHAARQPDEAAARRFDLQGLPAGALIGTVRLSEIEEFTPESWWALAEEHLDPGPYTRKLYAWKLTDPEPLPQPIPWRGKPGVFDVEVDLDDPAVPEAEGENPAQGALF